MMISCGTLISYMVSYYFDLKLDGYMGIILALFIVYSAVKTMMEISRPLIGAREDVEVNINVGIRDMLLGSQYIVVVDDLQVHTYGKSRIYSSYDQ